MCPSNPRKNYEHGENYFGNKFRPIKSDLSIPFNPPQSPVSPQAALWLFTTPELPFSSGPVSRVHLLPLQYLHILCLTQILTVVVQSLSHIQLFMTPWAELLSSPFHTHHSQDNCASYDNWVWDTQGDAAKLSPPGPRSSRITVAVFYWLLLFRCQVVSHTWTAAHPAPLSLTISQSLLKFLSIELVT